MAPADSPKLRLFLLGRFAVEYGGEPVPQSAWRRRRPVDLLTALALAPGFVLHREEIIDRLWPDKDLDAGANNLYRTLHDLRKVTGEDVVTVERGAVRLHETAWVDVAAFEKEISSGVLERLLAGLELYAGDLLPDDPYSDVIGQRREGLRQRFVDVALQVSRRDEVDADQRIAVLRRLIDVDPTLEEAHRLLMTALAEVGRPRDAAKQFAACAQALREHLGVTPSTETLRLHERIKGGDLQPSRAEPTRDDNWYHVSKRLLGTAEPRAIRGRDDVLEQIREFAEGEAGALVIAGEAGAGKTRLAVECAGLCAENGATILAGLGYDFEGAAPYTPFVDAWADLGRVLPGGDNPFVAFEPTPGGSAQEDRLRLFRAVESSLARLAGDEQVCILIEDLHQADESSLHLFHHLVRASRHLSLKMIGTLRVEEIRPGNPLHVLLASLGRERQTARLTLERLDKASTRELVADLWGKEPDPISLESIFRVAAGNPFYTEEVAAALLSGDSSTGIPVSSDIAATVRERIRQLGPEIERLLIAASIQGVRFDFEIARLAVDMEIDDALDALDRALSANVVEEQDRQYRFRHALMREALSDSLSHARRVHLHRKTAESLESRGNAEREPELLAHHHQLAGNLDQALLHTRAAIGHAQSRLGFGEAVMHSSRALELMDALGVGATEERFGVLRSRGAMRVALGDLDEAIADLDAAAALGDRSGWRPGRVARCGALRLAGLALIEAGLLDQAEEHLDAALEALGDEDAPGELCNIYYLYSQLRWHQNRHPEAFELAERCLAVAEKLGDVEAIAKGYEMLALACHSLGEWKKGRAYEEQRKEVADGTLDVASAFDVHL